MSVPDPTLDDDELFGAAFTGQRPVPPMQSIMEPAPQPAAGGGFLSNPADQAALLQIGLGLMQPVGFGQSTIGHIGQAIGGGGEAASRGEAEDLKRLQAESKLAIADERLRIAQQNADTRERRGVGRALKGLTAYQQYRQGRDEAKDVATAKKEQDKADLENAEAIAKKAEGAYGDPTNKYVQKGYHNMTPREIMKAERAAASAAPASGAPAAGKYGPPGTVLKQGGKTFIVDSTGNPVER